MSDDTMKQSDGEQIGEEQNDTLTAYDGGSKEEQTDGSHLYKKRTDKEQEKAETLFAQYRKELTIRQLSNTENYDKTIISLSSAGLAFSIALLNLLKPVGEIESIIWIQLSWFSFAIAISLAVFAYFVSNKSIELLLCHAEKYYICDDRDSLSKKNKYLVWNKRLNRLVGVFFIVAIFCVVFFAVMNFN